MCKEVRAVSAKEGPDGGNHNSSKATTFALKTLIFFFFLYVYPNTLTVKYRHAWRKQGSLLHTVSHKHQTCQTSSVKALQDFEDITVCEWNIVSNTYTDIELTESEAVFFLLVWEKHIRYFYSWCCTHDVVNHSDLALLADTGKMAPQPSHHTPLQPLRSWGEKRCPKRRLLSGGAEQRQADSSKGQRRPPCRIRALTWTRSCSRKVRWLTNKKKIRWRQKILVKNRRSLPTFSMNIWNNYACGKGSTYKLVWLCLHSNNHFVFPEDGAGDWFASFELI